MSEKDAEIAKLQEQIRSAQTEKDLAIMKERSIVTEKLSEQQELVSDLKAQVEMADAKQSFMNRN